MTERVYDLAYHRAETRDAYDRLAGGWYTMTKDGPYNGGLDCPAPRSLAPQPLARRIVIDAGGGCGVTAEVGGAEIHRSPGRAQLSRAAGWRLPIGAVSVAAPTKWSNPFRPTRRSAEANVLAVE